MMLKVMTPTSVLIDQEVTKIIATAPEKGSFCLLPRHIDFVSALAPGILSYEDDDGDETVLAVDEGILVKCGNEVSVSVNQAVTGGDLGTLRETVRRQFEQLDESERRARSALARLEADFVRRFVEISEPDR